MKFEIKTRFSGTTLFTAELDAKFESEPHSRQLGAAIKQAIKARANLTDANLTGANLTGAYLARANLARANLTDAYLTGANLTDANLAGANLTGAKNLPEAALAPIRNDLWDVLLRARNEVPFLLGALRAGKIDGSTYEGDCACLVGTIANGCAVPYWELANDLKPDSDRPIERWFMAIKPGHTPENSDVAKITEGWIVEFMRLAGIGDAAIEGAAL